MDIQLLLKQLVEIPSVYPDEQKISAFIVEYLTTLGFSVKIVTTGQDRNNIVATYGKAERYLGFYGHIDTVPPDPLYSQDPYTMWIEHGNIARGLGVCDMKGGDAAILTMAKYAISHHFPVKVIFGVDEEDISQGAHDLVDSGLINDIEYLIVAESGQVKDVTQDFSVVLGRKGRIVFDIEVIGKIAHAAESEKGINAIEKATLLIQEIEKINFPKHENLGNSNIVVQGIHSETGAMSVPSSCKIRYSLLTNPNTKSADFIQEVQQIAERLGIQITIQTSPRKTPYGESYETLLSHNFTQCIMNEIVAHSNVEPLYTPSVADENVFANRLQIPVITIGPIGGGDHTKDEWVNLDSLKKVEEVFKKCVQLFHETT